MSEPCEMCDDTGYEPGSDPLSFCTLCARALAVAIADAWYMGPEHGPQHHPFGANSDVPCHEGEEPQRQGDEP